MQEEPEGFGSLLLPGFRVAVFVGVVLAIFQQITGVNTIVYYSPAILRMAGFPSAKAAILASAIIGVMNVVTTLVAIALIDRVGRRLLLLLSTAGMTLALALVGAGFSRHASGGVVFCEVVFYMVSFNIGLGPVMWLLISEIYPTKIRGKAMSLATLSVWGSNWLVAGTFLSLLHAAGPAGTFWLYAGICVAAFIFCYAFVPETKGRSLEAIERHWRHFGEKKPGETLD